MNRVGVTAASAALFLLGASPVIADNHEEESDDGMIPVEIFGCTFEDGKGPDDLAAVTAKWNEWMDEEGATDYFAALMYPNYSSNLPFDVAWIGGWRDGNAMGAGTDMWIGSDNGLGEEFDAVLDCPAHIMFASMRMKAPEENDDEEDNTFVLAFSNCSIKDGKTFEDVQAAQEVWNAYADENGFKGGSWVMWPIWGEAAEADYDFKSVGSWPDYATLGANYQLMADGHWRKSNEIWDGLLDCDSARIYSSYGVRQMADEDE